jgi:hypothetical protein
VYLHFGQQRQSCLLDDFDYWDCIEVMAMPYFFSFYYEIKRPNWKNS